MEDAESGDGGVSRGWGDGGSMGDKLIAKLLTDRLIDRLKGEYAYR